VELHGEGKGRRGRRDLEAFRPLGEAARVVGRGISQKVEFWVKYSCFAVAVSGMMGLT